MNCVICGARVDNPNPKAKTCGRTCTDAREAGRTYAEQIKHEIEQADERAAATERNERIERKRRVSMKENYNAPTP